MHLRSETWWLTRSGVRVRLNHGKVTVLLAERNGEQLGKMVVFGRGAVPSQGSIHAIAHTLWRSRTQILQAGASRVWFSVWKDEHHGHLMRLRIAGAHVEPSVVRSFPLAGIRIANPDDPSSWKAAAEALTTLAVAALAGTPEVEVLQQLAATQLAALTHQS